MEQMRDQVEGEKGCEREEGRQRYRSVDKEEGCENRYVISHIIRRERKGRGMSGRDEGSRGGEGGCDTRCVEEKKMSPEGRMAVGHPLMPETSVTNCNFPEEYCT